MTRFQFVEDHKGAYGVKRLCEGVDLPQLDTLLLTMPISFNGLVVQELGRVTRVNRETLLAAQVHDYHDSHVPVFDRMFRKRQRIVAKKGFVSRPVSPT